MGAVTPVPMTIFVVLAKAAPSHGQAAPHIYNIMIDI